MVVLFGTVHLSLGLIMEVIGDCIYRDSYRIYAVLISTGILGMDEPVPMYDT